MTRRARAWILAVIGAGYVALAGAVLLWPNGAQVRQMILDVYLWGLKHGVPVWITPEWYAAAGNIALFLPAGVAMAVLLGPRRRGLAIAVGAAASAGVEFAQSLSGMARVPQWSDLALNSLGTVIGVLLTGWWFTRRGRSDPTLPPD